MRERERGSKCGGSKLVEVWVEEERRSRITGRAYLVRKAVVAEKGRERGGEEEKERLAVNLGIRGVKGSEWP